MAFRIKELCRQKNITLAQIADRIGINKVTLSQSLAGNPTLSRLQEVAAILGVEVPDLFERKRPETDVFGCLYVNNKPILISNIGDIKKMLAQLEVN